MVVRTLSRWNRLGTKVAAAITFVSVLTLGLFLGLVLDTQRRHLVGQAVRSGAMLSDTIVSSITNDMLHDRREEAYRVMDTIVRDEQVYTLRVLDGRGRVRYSTRSADVGTTADTRDDSCTPCHVPGRPTPAYSLAERARIVDHGGRRELSVVTPIYNQTACSAAACHAHPESTRIIGVLELGLGLDPVDNETRTLAASTAALALLATLAIAGFTWLLMRRLVVRPVAQLVDGTNRVRAGSFTETVPVGSDDEIGVLEQSFNDMEHTLSSTLKQRDDLLQNLEQQVIDRTMALSRAQEQLIQTEKLSSLGKLSASIAHEINNPLAGILTTSKLLQRIVTDDGQATPEQAMKPLKLIEREANRCTAIVRNLLGFARERPLELTSVDVNAALEEALFLIANQTVLQNIAIERDLEPLPPIEADFGQVRQAFANILINACDAMPKGGTLRVRTRPEPLSQRVRIEIADTGIGIPKEQLSKVMDPFFTTKEKGTGLGLSVVYGIVKRHGGRVDIESEPGIGSTIAIVLPEHAPASAAAPKLTEAAAT
jgi:two-component system NtrC family sensor kinase